MIFVASSLVVPGRTPASMSTCFIHPRSVSGFTPTFVPIRATAAVTDKVGSSTLASCTSRTARSLSSWGYFLGAGMVCILSRNQTLHDTRGGSS